jgi:tetratricopeptide (TPR) repeat protein
VRFLTIEWERLTDREFESLCCDVLDREGYKNLRWTGGTGDRGRDIQATKYVKMTETHERMYDVIAECKKYLARPPAISDLQGTLGWADVHKPDLLMLMIANTLTPNTHEWLDKTGQDKPYDILVFDDKHFELFFDRHPDFYAKHFGGRRIPRERIVRSLLDGKGKNLKSLSNQTELSEDLLGAILDKLVAESLISREESEGKDTCFSLKTGIAAFVQIAKLFLNGEGKFEFLASNYSESMVNTHVADYVESRYHIVLSGDHKQGLIKLLGISPSALHTALFSPTDKYDTGFAHAEQVGLRDDARDRWNQLLLTEFMSSLLEKAVADLRDPDVKTALAKNDIEGYDIGIKIKMANPKELVLGLGSEVVIMLLKAAGPVKAGQLLSATDPDLYVRTGDILLHLELFEQAIAEYDRAISEMKDKDKLAAAWNNKGVCFMALQRWRKAIPCFEKALEFNSSVDQPRKNIEKCKRALEA